MTRNRNGESNITLRYTAKAIEHELRARILNPKYVPENPILRFFLHDNEIKSQLQVNSLVLDIDDIYSIFWRGSDKYPYFKKYLRKKIQDSEIYTKFLVDLREYKVYSSKKVIREQLKKLVEHDVLITNRITHYMVLKNKIPTPLRKHRPSYMLLPTYCWMIGKHRKINPCRPIHKGPGQRSLSYDLPEHGLGVPDLVICSNGIVSLYGQATMPIEPWFWSI